MRKKVFTCIAVLIIGYMCCGCVSAASFNVRSKSLKIYEKYEYARIDAIVLGCTHYPHIKNLISKYFKNAVLLDGSNGVARETKRQ